MKLLLPIFSSPEPNPAPEIPQATEPQTTNADSSGKSAEPDAFDRAAEQVINGAGVQPSAAGDQSKPQGEVLPNFEKIADFIIPKPFQLMALLLENKEIDLSPTQKEIFVQMGAGAIEDIWPVLPDLFKSTAFPKLYAFGAVLAIGAAPNFALAWKTYNERRKAETKAPTFDAT